MSTSVAESVQATLSTSSCRDADLVLVVPPFASPDWPSLGVHILARLAEGLGLTASVVYANLSFARIVGPRLYRALCATRTGDLVGERLFRRACAHTAGLPGAQPRCWPEFAGGNPPDFGAVQDLAAEWAEAMGAALATVRARHVGFSTTFEQTLPSLALIEALKRHAPSKVVLLGGANTDGEMGPALREAHPIIDHVFVGEAESSFLAFASRGIIGGEPMPAVMQGSNNDRLDDLAPPDFSAFFAQFDATVRTGACPDGLDGSELRIPYETSRGCWWGAKHHCTFCGLNANGMTHRIKSPDKVFEEVHALSEHHGVDSIIMVDNIMPHSYFSTLLPRLQATEKRLRIFYEQKANISREKMALMKGAGVGSIQPGIESLSTSLLARMRKGSSAQTNIDCMRYARACGVDIVWNVLVDFPGDLEQDYVELAAIVPYVHHLAPPTGVSAISIDRFSPYHTDPAAFGVSGLRPLDVYRELFPEGDLDRISYHFEGDYDSAARRSPGLVAAVETAVEGWRRLWAEEPSPIFGLFELDAGRHLLVDTRPCARDDAALLDDAGARLVLRGARELTPEVSDALDRNRLAPIDGRYGALCCAALDLSAW